MGVWSKGCCQSMVPEGGESSEGGKWKKMLKRKIFSIANENDKFVGIMCTHVDDFCHGGKGFFFFWGWDYEINWCQFWDWIIKEKLLRTLEYI